MEALASWNALNAAIISADERTCNELLNAEKRGKGRRMFLLRIHSRLNRVRADRERQELVKISKSSARG